MKKVLWIGAVFVCISAQVFAGGGKESETKKTETAAQTKMSKSGSKTAFPIVINTMGIDVTFKKEPERIFALDYSIAELLVALGLKDKIVAVAPADYTLDNISPKYRDEFKNIHVLEGLKWGVPSFETVLKANPDFVYGTFYSFFPSNCGEASGYLEQGIAAYASEGTFVKDATIENTYNDIRNIGKIFNVQEKAEALIQEMQRKITSVKAVTDTVEPVKVAVIDGVGESLFSIGGTGLENKLLAAAGAQNLFSYTKEHYFRLSFEEIINKNPDVIVIFERNEKGDGQKKIHFVKNKSEFAGISAVKNNKFVIVSSFSMFPSLQNADAVVHLAKALHPDKF